MINRPGRSFTARPCLRASVGTRTVVRMIKTPKQRASMKWAYGWRYYNAATPMHSRIALVRRAPQSHATVHLGRFILDGRAYPCALGRTGISARKREGDGATPHGRMSVLSGKFRQDRVARPKGPQLFWGRIDARDGWCDASFTPAYNSQVALPHSQAHEVMTRDDHLYDRLMILDWNITRRGQTRGSAIFMHQARLEQSGMQPTEGCIALPAPVFAKLSGRLAQLHAVVVL